MMFSIRPYCNVCTNVCEVQIATEMKHRNDIYKCLVQHANEDALPNHCFVKMIVDNVNRYAVFHRCVKEDAVLNDFSYKIALNTFRIDVADLLYVFLKQNNLIKQFKVRRYPYYGIYATQFVLTFMVCHRTLCRK